MNGSPFQKGLPWIIGGLLLLSVSATLYLFDYGRSNEELLAQLEKTIQKDFSTCIDAASVQNFGQGTAETSFCQIAQLLYVKGRLSDWTNNDFLPAERNIKRLRQIPDQALLTFENRSFYQLRKAKQDSTLISLIPLRITYEVKNQFLIPYTFLGSQRAVFEGRQNEIRLSQITVEIGENDGEIVITDNGKEPVLSIRNFPTYPMRETLRLAVLVLLFLGAVSLAIFLRIYATHRWKYRYMINVVLFFGIIAIRLIIHWANLPGDYVDLEIFSPSILASDELYAPTLGHLTLNIFTFLVLFWIVYVHFFRIINVWYKKLLNRKGLAWPAMFLTTFISYALIIFFYHGFRLIIRDSQIDIEFSNIFQTDFFSYLVLLNEGVRFFYRSLIVFLLIRLNVLYGRRYGFNGLFLAAQIGMLVVSNVLLYSIFEPTILEVVITTLALGLIAFMIFRFPYRQILRHDTANFLVFTLVVSMCATFAVVKGIGQKNRIKADRIAEDILGDQGADIAINLLYAMDEMARDLSVIKQRRTSFRNDERFAEWIENRYLIPQFSGFNPRMSLYGPEGEVIVNRDVSGFFGPETGIRLEDQAIQVNEYLYQYPNRQNKYLDNYVGRFFLPLGQDTISQYQVLLDLRPNVQEATDLYPSLVLDQTSYENLRLLNSFDYAVYREGLLATEAGEYAFPIELEMPSADNNEKVRSDLGMVERYYSLTNTKVAVVRFPLQDALNIITTFSFIFYFFLIGAVMLILIPVWLVRYLRDRKINVSSTLRARIRFGLLSISLLPMLVIVIVLYPFIRTKYFEQAQNELAREAGRIASAVGPEYSDMVTDELSTRYQWQKFEDRIRNLSPTLRNDINIFDADGRRIATTQPLAFDGAFATDLMEAEAYQRLKQGGVSELIIEESIGTLTYISCYRPLIGASSRPMGYVNIPYLTQQDELNGQVLDFLAYLANIYLLVFLLINLIAVLVASTITKPLSVIRQRIAATRLGDKNEPIRYESEDEIGEIVAAYNGMLDQLEESEKQLTQNQREEAWRQMARQVAHEIKNPLTPMKLSIQHLKRSWQENAPRFQNMFPKVMKTLLVQIDSMVHIANSFSEFARMPEPINTRIKVNDVLLEVVDLYTQSQEAIWLIDIPKEPFWVFADRDQLSRSFNNIIKNALQAIETNGILHISMRVEDLTAFIEIKDNGKGIPEEIQQKVFEPSFSTKNSGMGLGLAIVRRIIEHANGRIRFESEEGVGTTFYIQLPAARTEPEPARIGQ